MFWVFLVAKNCKGSLKDGSYCRIEPYHGQMELIPDRTCNIPIKAAFLWLDGVFIRGFVLLILFF